MKKGLFSLRTATMISFLVIMFSVLTVFVVLNIKDYEWLAKEQGSRILGSLYENTELKLSTMLSEPERANRYYGDLISRYDSFKSADMAEIEPLTLETMKLVREDMPQVSAMSIGNEDGAFVGYRLNADESYSLMVIDEKTHQILRIYEGVHRDTEILASFEGYDPRTRPWYEPVQKNQKPQWSEIYVNYDEIMEMTITSLVPIMDKEGQFQGTTGMDVKLNNIATFLQNDRLKGNGLIYIVDENWKIVSNSSLDTFVEISGEDPAVAERMDAKESSNRLMQKSALKIQEDQISSEEVFQMTIEGERYYGISGLLNKPESLNWRIIAVIPESDIMGTVKERLNDNLVFVFLFLVVGSIIGMLMISVITKPILKSSEAAIRIADGEWEVALSESKLPLYEISEFVTAFNIMIQNLKTSFSLVQESEKKYRSLVESSDDDIYSLAEDGTFLSVNHTFAKNLRTVKEEIVGKKIEEVFKSKEAQEIWYDRLNDVIEHKKSRSFQFNYMKSQDQEVIINVKLVPIFNHEEKIDHVLGTNTNVTELMEARLRIEQLLKDKNTELEKLVMERTEKLEATMKELMEQERLASLGSLVTGVAHEVNTPLGVAVSAGSYLSRTIEELITKFNTNQLTKGSMKDHLEAIEESGHILNANLKKASELITSFKRISVLKGSEERIEFRLHELIQSVLIVLKHEYKEMACDFVIDCPEDFVIFSDQSTYSQILTHLIMNSIIHGFKDRQSGTIGILVEKSNEEIFVMTYTDNGVGISEEDLKYIFDPFFTTNRTRGRSGLGLNIVYNLITGRLNGKIVCESTHGEGTRFVMEIPLKDLER